MSPLGKVLEIQAAFALCIYVYANTLSTVAAVFVVVATFGFPKQSINFIDKILKRRRDWDYWGLTNEGFSLDQNKINTLLILILTMLILSHC